MKIVALGQQKGGVGKTATAINLACQALEADETVTLVDMDPEQGTVTKWSKRRNGALPPLNVVTADATTIHAVLERLRAQGIQWAILDLPGRRSPIASAGFMAADMTLVPCRPLAVDIEASVDTVKALVRGKKGYAYLMNIAPHNNESQRARMVAELIQKEGHPTCPVILVQRIQVPDAIGQGKGVNEFAPGSNSAAEYKELFQWLKKTVK